MRLINVHTLQFQDFPATVLKPAPPYAILSHTWAYDEEVSYDDFQNPSKRATKKGFAKIRLTCDQAKQHDLSYVWVDTCCIDKSSSAELSEAINSMFRWYKQAQVCYAYLTDLTVQDTPESANFKTCRWFTRGWTLQELIASSKLEFYVPDADSASTADDDDVPRWTKLADRQQITAQLERITAIDASVLDGGPLTAIPVAKRMKWAAQRDTTREEDIAYCLMGIFDVNMPMIYGEGSKAFIRLQEEILKQSDDQSIFTWRATNHDTPYRGILASSPKEFQTWDEDMVPFRTLRAGNQIPPTITSRGIPLTTMMESSGEGKLKIGVNCRYKGDFTSVVGIEVVCQGGDLYLRSSPGSLFKCDAYGEQETVYLAKASFETDIQRLPDLGFQHGFYLSKLPPEVKIVGLHPDTISFSPAFPVIPLGSWTSGKAAIELEVPWSSSRVLLMLWARPLPGSRGYDSSFAAALVPASNMAYAIKSTASPKQVEEPRISFGVNGSLVLRGQDRKVQGFDMFCIEAEYSPAGIRGKLTRRFWA